MVTNYTVTPAAVTHSGRNADNTADESPLVWNKSYTTYTWGKEVDKSTFGPNEAVKGETQYKYYATTGSGAVAPDGQMDQKPQRHLVEDRLLRHLGFQRCARHGPARVSTLGESPVGPGIRLDHE